MKFLRIGGFILSSVIVLAVALGGLMYANQRALSVGASEATLVSDTYSVGTAYAGFVASMSIQPGTPVVRGQELLRLQSSTLQQSLQTSRLNPEGVGYRVEGDDVLVFTAVADGIVRDVEANIGSFVPGNSIIAVVGISNTLHLEASFPMNARDYARMQVGGDVDVRMPDGTSRTLALTEFHVGEERDGQPQVVVVARDESLGGASVAFAGAPVAAALELRGDEDLGSWVVRQVGKLFVPGGFR